MAKKLIFPVVLFLAFSLNCPLKAANIIWVSDAYDERVDSIPDDQGWVDLLVAQGYTVDYTKGASLGNGYWRTLDAAKIARLDAADLVIVSRATDSASYDDGQEITQWNSIKTPLILINVYIARGGTGSNFRWRWANSESLAADGGTPTLEALDPHHPIFKGVALNAKNQVDIYDQKVGTGTVSFFNFADMGKGTRLAKPATQAWTAIAEWPAGVEFYTGAGQIAADRRMLFCAATREGVGFGRGEYNLNAEGVKLFLNAVEYMLGNLVREPWVKAWNPDPPDGTQNVTTPLLKWWAGETAIWHDVYLGTNPTLGPADYKGRVTPLMYFHGPGFTPGTNYYWRIDEVEADSVTVHKGDTWSFTAATLTAHKPSPPDGAKWVDIDVDLTWLAGSTGIWHDVYFGTDQTAVANGTGGTFKVNQSATTYDPGTLKVNTTYYWRVDEIEVDKTTKHTGDVWSFTTIRPGGGIRGQYYRNSDLSGAAVINRIDPQIDFNWGAGSPDASLPVDDFSVRWSGELEVPFSEVYTFYTNADDGVRLWVADQLIINLWTDRRAPTEAKATIALAGGQRYPTVMEYYQGNADGDAVAQLSWESPSIARQIIPQAALLPPLRASGPSPANGATNVKDVPTLAWTAGEKASKHDVYFGTDASAVANATPASTGIYRGQQNLSASSYVPTEAPLAWNKTYYWRIDEVNNLDPEGMWKGGVWSFTTANFIVVDDFEDYTDDVGNRIFQTWRDGWGFSEPPPGYPGNGTGSAVGYSAAPFAEQTIVHGGNQSMPLAYDNTGAGGKARYSETQREWSLPQDWTRNNVKALTLYFYGDPNNAAEQLYVALEDNAGHVKVVNYPELDAVVEANWHEWNIELSQFSAAGVNLKAIKKMYIGLGNRVSPKAGGTGTMYIDDIRVHPSRCVPSKSKPAADLSGNCVVDAADVDILANLWLDSGFQITPVNPGTTGLVAQYPFNGNTNDVVGGHNGTAIASPTYTTGKIGQAILLNGVDQMVDVGAVGISGAAPRTIAGWAKANATPASLADWINIFGFTGPSGNYGHFDIELVNVGARGYGLHVYGWERLIMPMDLEWHHLAASYDGTTTKWYGDGRLVSSDSTLVLATPDNVHMGKRDDNEVYFPGRVDEVYIYSRELSGPEIAWLAGYTSPFSIAADLQQDDVINFKDFAKLADSWLEQVLWP